MSACSPCAAARVPIENEREEERHTQDRQREIQTTNVLLIPLLQLSHMQDLGTGGSHTRWTSLAPVPVTEELLIGMD